MLVKIISMTAGPVAELGCGLFSTPYLHWACHPVRSLVTFEAKPEWFQFADAFKKPFHDIQHVSEWSDVDLSSPWSVAFVDHDNVAHRRCEEVARLTHAEYVVAHDAENSQDAAYGYSTIKSLFRYRWTYRGAKAHTLVLSNFHDISAGLEIP